MYLSTICIALAAFAAGVPKMTVAGEVDDSVTVPYGHLKPLGAHRPPEGDIDSLDAFPDPKTFYEKYVKVGRPVVFKGAAKGIPAFKRWTDEYLAQKYGKMMVDVEAGKKENRSLSMKQISLAKFLQVYKQSEIYLVQDVQPAMKGDLSMLKPLMCGGFILEVAVLWFSSGNTKSVLHKDNVENINCIFDGDKDIVFVDKAYQAAIEKVGWHVQGSFSDVDVEKVDMNTYSHFASVPWWRARMEKGDCLYIPLVWYHTVASSNTRNLACNLWFNPMLMFNASDCDRIKEPLPDYASLAKYKFRNLPLGDELFVDNIRYFVFEAFRDMKEIRLSDAMKAWSEIISENEAKKVFDLVDVDSDGILSWEEVFAADILAIVRQYPHVMPGLDEQDIAEITDQLLQGGGGEGEEEEGAGEGDMQEEEGWENVKEEL